MSDNTPSRPAEPEAPVSEVQQAPETLAADAAPVADPVRTAEQSLPAPAGGDEESFAAMFEAQSAPGARLAPGQRVTATVVAVTADTVFVSTGSKVDGIVERSELEENGGTVPAVGEQLDLYVVAVSPQEVRLSKMVRGAGGLAVLEEAREARLPVEGKVQAIVKGGFAVEVMKRRAFCPLGQMELRPVDNPEAFIGKTFPFVLTKLEKGGRNIVLSRRVLLEAEQAENREAFLAGVSTGDVLEGKVARLAPFGVFVELAPGVEGLIHLSELAWGRVAAADEVVAVGDAVRVKILEIAATGKVLRISLSVRQVTEDPWKTVSERIHDGGIVTGKVVRNAEFGSFVEVLPGIDGLIHVSELSWDRNVRKPSDKLAVGETVTVKVKGLDVEKRRLSLSLRDMDGDPWSGVDEDFPIGAEVTGTLEKRAPFGIFVTLRPGVTGLLPASAITSSKSRGAVDAIKEGETLTVVVREVDMQARKATLALPDSGTAEAAQRPGRSAGKPSRPEKAREDRDWKNHVPKAEGGSFGNALGAAMQAALQKKK
jgi:small subunit ribosomal protein S1